MEALYPPNLSPLFLRSAVLCQFTERLESAIVSLKVPPFANSCFKHFIFVANTSPFARHGNNVSQKGFFVLGAIKKNIP